MFFKSCRMCGAVRGTQTHVHSGVGCVCHYDLLPPDRNTRRMHKQMYTPFIICYLLSGPFVSPPRQNSTRFRHHYIRMGLKYFRVQRVLVWLGI